MIVQELVMIDHTNLSLNLFSLSNKPIIYNDLHCGVSGLAVGNSFDVNENFCTIAFIYCCCIVLTPWLINITFFKTLDQRY